jgi:hypothetical protein
MFRFESVEHCFEQTGEREQVSTAIQAQLYMRLQDRHATPLEGGRLSVHQITNTWAHTDPEPHNLREVRISGGAEALRFECFGTGTLVPLHSVAVRASTIFAANPGSREGMAFFAELDFRHMVSRFQGNVNLGLLVLAGFHDFQDGSARSNYFSREFFYSGAGRQSESSNAGISGPGEGGSRRLDASALVGFWRNANAGSQGVATVEVTDRGEHVGIRAYGVGESGSVNWGEVPGRVYAKDCSSSDAMAFSAAFSSEGIRCHLQANVKQGVLVIAYFTEFQDVSGRSNYFAREFYYKER